MRQMGTENSHVDYVPDFGAVHFFRWKGYWLQVSRLHDGDFNRGNSEPVFRHPKDTAITLRSVAGINVMFERLMVFNFFSAFTRVTILCYLHL